MRKMQFDFSDFLNETNIEKLILYLKKTKKENIGLKKQVRVLKEKYDALVKRAIEGGVKNPRALPKKKPKDCFSD